MKKKFEIKPYTEKERQRIESGINANELSIFFFGLISLVLTISMIYGIYKSKDILIGILFTAFIIGECIYFVSLIRGFISDIRESKILLVKNEKYCSKGYINKKWFKYYKLSAKSSMTCFYIEIDDIEYEISRENYEEINSGDYVYYEVKTPLLTIAKKTDSNS